MILYQNGLITLDYTPATDVLSVELPDAVAFGVSELERSLEIVADSIRDYDIKKLLLDSSQAEIGRIDDQTYKAIVTGFISNLTKARLQKLARLNTTIPAHEDRLVSVTSEATLSLGSLFDIRMFTCKSRATDWLLDQ